MKMNAAVYVVFLYVFSTSLVFAERFNCPAGSEILNPLCRRDGAEGEIHVPDVLGQSSRHLTDMFTRSAIPIPDSLGKVKAAEPLHENCVEEKQCEVTESPLATDYTDFLLNFSKFQKTKIVKPMAETSTKDCSCLRKKFNSPDLEKKLEDERAFVNRKILGAIGKKFLNDFATNLEDMSFFLTRNREMFLNDERAKSYQCNSPEMYNDQIEAICSRKGITDKSFIQGRKDFFINSLDGGKLSFESRLPQMSAQIQSIPYPGTNKFYTRYEFDNMRLGMAHNYPMAKTVDHLVLKIMTNPDISARLVIEMGTMTPVQALLHTIEKNKDNPQFVKLFDPKVVGEILHDKKKLQESFSFLMNTHPGFLTAMEDMSAFEMLAESLQKGRTSVLETLETDPTVLEPTLVKRCSDLLNDFANAVCTPDHELISQMDDEDLEKLIHTEESESISSGLHEILICEKKTVSIDERFNELSKLDDLKIPSRRADFLERLTSPDVNDHVNAFSKSMLSSKDKKTRAEMGEMAEAGARRAKSVSTGGVASLIVHATLVEDGKVISLGKPSMTREDAKKYLAENKKYEARMESERIARLSSGTKKVDAVAYVPVKDVPEIAQATVNPVPEIQPERAFTQTPARTQLARELSRTNPPQQVEKVLSNVSNSTVEELNRLKAEEASLLQREFEFESRRMEDMQRKVDELQTKIAKPQEVTQAPQQTPAQNIESPKEEARVSSKKEIERVGSAQVVEQKENPVKTAGTVSSSAATADSSDGSSNGRGKPSSVDAQNIVANTQATAGALTLNEVSREKINEEVGKLLESPSLEQSSLDEIRTKGLKVKIKVMENNRLVEKEIVVKFSDLDQKTRDLIELKFAKKERDQQVSKLAVLRMLMGRYQR